MGAWCLAWHCSVVLKHNTLLWELLYGWEEVIFRFLLSMPLGHINLATRASRSWLQKMPGSAQCFPCNAFFLLFIQTLYLLIVYCSFSQSIAQLFDSESWHLYGWLNSSSSDFLGSLKSTQEGALFYLPASVLLHECFHESHLTAANDTLLFCQGRELRGAAIVFSLAVFCFLFFWQCHVLRRKGLKK